MIKNTYQAILSLCLLVSFNTSAQVMIPKSPTLSAGSYILMDYDTGFVIAEKDSDKTLAPASLTKLMTAYVVSEEIKKGTISWDDPVAISVNVWRKGGSKMFVREGTHVPLHDLIRGIIIQSGNDASVAVAEHIAGEESAFAEVMNHHAQRLGLTNSQFKNATGWPAEGHYTSARDMAYLAHAIIKRHPEHYKLYSEKEFTFNGIRQSNRNKLLWADDSVDGLKTGHTEEAGYCLVASAKREDMRLISVVLGSSSSSTRTSDSKKLLAYGFRYYQTDILFKTNQIITNTAVWFGEQDVLPVGIAKANIATYPRGQKNI